MRSEASNTNKRGEGAGKRSGTRAWMHRPQSRAGPHCQPPAPLQDRASRPEPRRSAPPVPRGGCRSVPRPPRPGAAAPAQVSPGAGLAAGTCAGPGSPVAALPGSGWRGRAGPGPCTRAAPVRGRQVEERLSAEPRPRSAPQPALCRHVKRRESEGQAAPPGPASAPGRLPPPAPGSAAEAALLHCVGFKPSPTVSAFSPSSAELQDNGPRHPRALDIHFRAPSAREPQSGSGEGRPAGVLGSVPGPARLLSGWGGMAAHGVGGTRAQGLGPRATASSARASSAHRPPRASGGSGFSPGQSWRRREAAGHP